jgi:hypothetical protein
VFLVSGVVAAGVHTQRAVCNITCRPFCEHRWVILGIGAAVPWYAYHRYCKAVSCAPSWPQVSPQIKLGPPLLTNV